MKTFKILGLLLTYPVPETLAHWSEMGALLASEKLLPKRQLQLIQQWIDEQIAVALHKSNVYIDLSGWSPKYIPSQLIREVNSRLQDKVMFGSDFPYLKPDRWLNEFDQLQLKPEVYKKVIYDNARKVIKGLPD